MGQGRVAVSYEVSLDAAEREWLVVNLYVGEDGALRGWILGTYLTVPDDIPLVADLSERDLWALDKAISGANPFYTKLSSGQLLATLGVKVWRHLARMHAPPEFKPEEVTDAPVSAGDDTDRDADVSEHASVRGPGFD